MHLSAWFSKQLTASAEGFSWAIAQIPAERWYLAPPRHPDNWSAARILFHMCYYEEQISLPYMRGWLDAPTPFFPLLADARAWEHLQGKSDVEVLLAEFQAVREQQIALLPSFDANMWHEVRKTVWGTVSLKWVVTKIYQHTCEHTHEVLRMGLFWDHQPGHSNVPGLSVKRQRDV